MAILWTMQSTKYYSRMSQQFFKSLNKDPTIYNQIQKLKIQSPQMFIYQIFFVLSVLDQFTYGMIDMVDLVINNCRIGLMNILSIC